MHCEVTLTFDHQKPVSSVGSWVFVPNLKRFHQCSTEVLCQYGNEDKWADIQPKNSTPPALTVPGENAWKCRCSLSFTLGLTRGFLAFLHSNLLSVTKRRRKITLISYHFLLRFKLLHILTCRNESFLKLLLNIIKCAFYVHLLSWVISAV